jgi:RNA polymerase sigma factor (sigma-70 family)
VTSAAHSFAERLELEAERDEGRVLWGPKPVAGPPPSLNSPAEVDRLVRSCLGLVYSVARDFHWTNIPRDDLVSDGNIGLVEAARRFRGDAGAKFSTYAMCWIRRYVMETVSNGMAGRTLGGSERNLRYLVLRACSALAEDDQEITDESIADYIRNVNGETVTADRVRAVRAPPPRSLDAPVGNDDDGDLTLMGLVPDETLTPVDELIEQREQTQACSDFVERALAGLTDREQEVMRLRFLADPALTLQEIACKFGLTKERIRQIEKLAVNKLRSRFGSAFWRLGLKK